MKRSLLALALLLTSEPSWGAGEGVNTNLFRPATPGSGYFVHEDPACLLPGELRLGVALDGSSQPLVVRDPVSGEAAPGGKVVAARLALHLGAAYGLLDRLQLGVLVVASMQHGEARSDRAEPPLVGLGDLVGRAKIELVRGAGFGVSLLAELSLPTASPGAYLGDPSVTFRPGLAVGWEGARGGLAAHLGYVFRGATVVDDLLVDDELVAGLAGRLALVPNTLWLQADLLGAVGTLGKGNELERPVETIAGARLRVGSGWTAQAGVGFGLTRGYGAPLVRGVLSLAFSPPHARPRAVSRWIPPEPPEPPEPSLPPPPPATPVVRVIGDRIILPASVLFALAGDEVTAEGQRVLDEVFALWARHPEWERLLIEGHTDVRGRAAYNLDLSHRRAENVRLGLVRAGAEANRIDAVGLGEARPASDGQTEEHHARNRRVEFVITERRVLE